MRVIPINNTFVGNMHYDATAAKNQIASMGQYNICVYGTDWEVAAEMNEHDGTFFLIIMKMYFGIAMIIIRVSMSGNWKMPFQILILTEPVQA